MSLQLLHSILPNRHQISGKLPEKLKHLKLESVKLNHHEKLKIYGVSNRIDFKTSGQRNVCQ